MVDRTPGPWTVEEYGDEECPALVIHRDSERRVCFMATPGSHGDPAMIEADARLIAAAPDLLAELDKQLDAHLATWMAARAEVEGASTSRALFEKEPDVISARAAVSKATSV